MWVEIDLLQGCPVKVLHSRVDFGPPASAPPARAPQPPPAQPLLHFLWYFGEGCAGAWEWRSLLSELASKHGHLNLCTCPQAQGQEVTCMEGECFHTCGETKGTRLLVMGPTVSWLVGGRGQMGSEAFGGLLPPPHPGVPQGSRLPRFSHRRLPR